MNRMLITKEARNAGLEPKSTMTKLEHMSLEILKVLLSRHDFDSQGDVCEEAVRTADYLLEALQNVHPEQDRLQ